MQTIRFKLLLGYGVLGLLSLTLIAAFWLWGNTIKRDVNYINDIALPEQRNASELRSVVSEIESTLYAFYATSIDADTFENLLSAKLEQANQLKQNLSDFNNVSQSLQELAHHGSELRQALAQNDWDLARDILAAASQTRGALTQTLNDRVTAANDYSQQKALEVYGTVSRQTWSAGVFLLVVIGLSLAVAIYIGRGIIRPINQLAHFAHSVADESDLSKKTTIIAMTKLAKQARRSIPWSNVFALC